MVQRFHVPRSSRHRRDGHVACPMGRVSLLEGQEGGVANIGTQSTVARPLLAG
jgi:hypothetical protein